MEPDTVFLVYYPTNVPIKHCFWSSTGAALDGWPATGQPQPRFRRPPLWRPWTVLSVSVALGNRTLFQMLSLIVLLFWAVCCCGVLVSPRKHLTWYQPLCNCSRSLRFFFVTTATSKWCVYAHALFAHVCKFAPFFACVWGIPNRRWKVTFQNPYQSHMQCLSSLRRLEMRTYHSPPFNNGPATATIFRAAYRWEGRILQLILKTKMSAVSRFYCLPREIPGVHPRRWSWGLTMRGGGQHDL